MSIWLGLLLFLGAAPVSVARNHAEELHLLKAAFLYNFAKFTRWPEGTWEKKEGPLSLCTVGADELVGTLQRLEGRMVRGRVVNIVLLQDEQPERRCHLLYIAWSKQDKYREIIASLGQEAVLTVSEIPGFSRSGGIIELRQEQDRVRFIINQSAAHRAGLKLNSRLLNLATEVLGQLP